MIQSGAVHGIFGVGRDQAVLRRGQAAFLEQHVGSGRCAQVQLLDFGVEALFVVVPGGDGGSNQRAVVGESELLIHRACTDWLNLMPMGMVTLKPTPLSGELPFTRLLSVVP